MTTTAAGQTGTIRPFTVTIPQEALDDAKAKADALIEQNKAKYGG